MSGRYRRSLPDDPSAHPAIPTGLAVIWRWRRAGALPAKGSKPRGPEERTHGYGRRANVLGFRTPTEQAASPARRVAPRCRYRSGRTVRRLWAWKSGSTSAPC